MTEPSTNLPVAQLEERPLVTFALFAYNQEAWVRDAVEGALAQDYPNLEIILSDDASTDGTWAVIQQTAAEHVNKHRIIFNRNVSNLGLCGHVNAIFERASGELIVVAAGDDVSCSNRVSQLVSEWLKHGKPEAVLHSSVEVLTTLSKTKTMRDPPVDRLRDLSLQNYVKSGLKCPILGATAAYTPGIYHSFGPLNPAGGIEDGPMVFRALLIGAQFLEIKSPLITYRFTGENVSAPLTRVNPQHTRRYLKICQHWVEQHLIDLKNSPVDDSNLQRRIEIERSRLVASQDILAKDVFTIMKGLVAYTRGLHFSDRAHIFISFFGLQNNNLIRAIRYVRGRFKRHVRQRQPW